MDEPSNYEMSILILKMGGLVLAAYLVVKILDPLVKRWTGKIAEERETLEEEYGTYSSEQILLLLSDVESASLLEMTATLNVAETHVRDERIRLRIRQLRSSKVRVIRMRTQDIIAKWESEDK